LLTWTDAFAVACLAVFVYAIVSFELWYWPRHGGPPRVGLAAFEPEEDEDDGGPDEG
jgi:hypothetical protein